MTNIAARFDFHVADPPAGGARDPRGALDFMHQDGAITRREYDAGRFLAACYASADARCLAIVESCEQTLGYVEIDMAALVRAVVVRHKRPLTVEGTRRLRHGLGQIAMHIEQIEIGWLTRPITERAAELDPATR
jgi:hypothetical protein